ncbi:UNVERIFIED_CONTAM: polyprotein [Sesamum radiatum]|uniref:Polyprotein n=1 Tax=Sesamum radiatum TaxID=300843 RepID=A0AAW2PIS6_SESRA
MPAMSFGEPYSLKKKTGRNTSVDMPVVSSKDSEKHYHAVYKEILAIKYGIKKFEFHLIGHHFTILMDNTSFPKIMDLKNKGVPEPLLRLKDWFSKYQFTVKHIQGRKQLNP